MTTAANLFDLVCGALTPAEDGAAPTIAGANVDRPGVLPTQPDQYPRLKMRMMGETKLSQGRGTVGFTTTPTIRIVGELSAPVSIADAKVSSIEANLWIFKAQIERAIINSSPLFAQIQQLVSVTTQLSFDAQATMLAGIQSDYMFEIYEDEDDFAAIATAPLLTIDAGLPGGPGFDADLPQ